MRIFMILSICFLMSNCKEPEVELENWHVYAIPTSECNLYSDIPCTPKTMPNNFSNREDAQNFANQRMESHENILWVDPSKMEKEEIPPKTVVITETVLIEDPSFSQTITTLETTLASKEQTIYNLEQELLAGNPQPEPEPDPQPDPEPEPQPDPEPDPEPDPIEIVSDLTGSCSISSFVQPNEENFVMEEPLIILNGHYLCYENGKKQQCINGDLENGWSGSSCKSVSELYRSTNPDVYDKASCNLNGKIIPHGTMELAYSQEENYPWEYCWDTPYNRWRVCNDGVMSGDPKYEYPSCGRESYRKKVARTEDLSQCLRIDEHTYFPLTESYQSVVDFEPYNITDIYDEYPIAACKNTCFTYSNSNMRYIPHLSGSSQSSIDACHSCEMNQYSDQCFEKRNYYLPFNSTVELKLDDL